MLCADCWWSTLILTAVVIFLLYIYLSYGNSYWRRLGVPCPEPELFFGHSRRLFFTKESYSGLLQRIYDQLDGEPFGGFYMMNTPNIILRDINLINRILIADFNHFTDRLGKPWTEVDPMSQHLFTLGGSLWKEMRLRMSCVFSVEYTQRTFFMVQECSSRLQKHIEVAIADHPGREFELKELLSSFTTDVIGMCAFGIECGTLDDPNSQFRHIGSLIFEKTRKGFFRTMFAMMLPRAAKLLRTRFFNPTVSEFFDRIVMETFQYRKQRGILRDDLIHLMMELKESGLPPEKDGEAMEITHEFLVSQMLLAFALGFEVTSATMSFCLHELSLHPQMQSRAHMEVDEILSRHGGELTYEAVQEMTYLDMVVAETLRLYPPCTQLIRQCTKPYRIPDSDVVLQKGTLVYVPVLALHRDPRFFPDPLLFNPERFRHSAGFEPHDGVSGYLPFGSGPRACLGQKFAQVEMKAGLAALLSRFEFRRCPRSSGSPADFDHLHVLGSPAGGLWVRVLARPWISLR